MRPTIRPKKGVFSGVPNIAVYLEPYLHRSPTRCILNSDRRGVG